MVTPSSHHRTCFTSTSCHILATDFIQALTVKRLNLINLASTCFCYLFLFLRYSGFSFQLYFAPPQILQWVCTATDCLGESHDCRCVLSHWSMKLIQLSSLVELAKILGQICDRNFYFEMQTTNFLLDLSLGCQWVKIRSWWTHNSFGLIWVWFSFGFDFSVSTCC